MELRSRSKEGTKPTAATAPKQGSDAERLERRRNWVRRTWTGLLMIGSFLALIFLGHWACVGLILALEAAMFRELQRVRSQGANATKHAEIPAASGWVDWGLFFAASYFIVGRVLISNYAEQFVLYPLGRLHVRYHTLVSFGLYCAVFVLFVCTLQSGQYKRQFIQFAWTHMVLISVVLQANLWIHNVFKGLFWLILPASLVIVNDIFAFFAGSLLGRTPLIALSPKKTWEGWIGGTVATYLWGFFFAGLLARFQWLTCPKLDPIHWDVAPCAVPDVFVPVRYAIPLLGVTVTLAPVQLHALVLATFASIVAPFGGFFASGMKRAFSIKDFNNVIPGHGGITDRFDCQLLTGTFSNIYISTFVYKNPVTSVFGKLAAMDTKAQLEIFHRLRDLLVAKGAIL